MAHGRAPDTPVALVRWGTHPEQQVLTGTLADIAEQAKRVGFKPPAITVVGEVVSLRERLRWFDNRPLFGKGILVTRAADQAGEFSGMLAALGAMPVECPTISIVPPLSWDELDGAMDRLGQCSWVIFTSVNAVHSFFRRLLERGQDSRALGSCRVCAVGPKTAASLGEYGIRPDLVPADYKAEGVVAEFGKLEMEGRTVLFPRADKARDVIPTRLAQMGAQVLAPVAYRNVIPGTLPSRARQAMEERRIHCVTFTSSSTVENLATMVGGENRLLSLLEGVAVAAIGPVTAATCRELGLEVHIEATEYTLATLTDDIVRYFST
jgi:uroporphyrinogen III methyltransferase/synthase